MEWHKITVKNFLSFEEFTLNLHNRGLVLIEGVNNTSNKYKSNGSGKSSLLDGVVYALYDTTSKGIKADDVINQKVGKNTSVILEGVKGEDKYRIERYRKHKTHKNKVKLFINDEEVTAKSTADTNKEIEKIIGMDYATFINSIMFTQDEGAGKFATATDKEKKEILENLINLGIYANAQDIAKMKVKAKQDEITQVERDLDRAEWNLDQVTVLEEEDQANFNNTQQMITQERDKYAQVYQEMEDYSRSVIAQVTEAENQIDTLQKERQTLENPPSTQDVSNNVLNAKSALRDLQHSIDAQERIKAELLQKYKHLQTSTHCPVCGNELDNPHREKETEDIRNQLKGVLMQLQNLRQSQTPLENEFNNAVSQYQQTKAIEETVLSRYRGIDQQIATHQAFIQNHENHKRTLQNKVDVINATIERLHSIPQPAPRIMERKKAQVEIKTLKDTLMGLHKEKNILEDTVKIFSNSGVKSHVLDLKTPFLNERANKYLAMLAGTDMEIKFSTQTPKKDGEMTEKFDVQLVNTAGGPSYKANSAGEKKRADLSIALALQDLVLTNSNQATNFAVYDEVFDALDDIGAENVVTLLKERQDTMPTIFVITHNEHLKALFDTVITVEKNKEGVSTLIEGVTT